MRLIRIALILLAFLLPFGAVAEPLELDAAAMRRLAHEAVTAGFAEDALQITDALLLRDPQDATALILRAQALRLLGRYRDSAAAARAAWRAAEGDGARYGAAMVLAQALSLQDRRLEAQIWLRAAAENAPSDRARAKATEDFNYVRDATPLTLDFSLSVRPSDNVNGGARSKTFTIYDNGICAAGCPGTLSGAALALSGVEGEAALDAEYRLHDSATSQGVVLLSFSQSAVYLSSEAHIIAPSAKNSDFAMTTLDIGYGERLFSPRNGSDFGAELHGGRIWYGGEHLQDYLLGSLTASFDLGQNLGFDAEITVQRQTQPDPFSEAAYLGDAQISLTRNARNGDQWSLGLGGGQTRSSDPFKQSTRQTVSLDWAKAAPVWGMALQANLAADLSNYPLSFYTPKGRHDYGLSGALSAQIDKWEFMGFAPVISLEATRNWSNVGIYDTQNLGVGFAITSTF